MHNEKKNEETIISLSKTILLCFLTHGVLFTLFSYSAFFLCGVIVLLFIFSWPKIGNYYSGIYLSIIEKKIGIKTAHQSALEWHLFWQQYSVPAGDSKKIFFFLAATTTRREDEKGFLYKSRSSSTKKKKMNCGKIILREREVSWESQTRIKKRCPTPRNTESYTLPSTNVDSHENLLFRLGKYPKRSLANWKLFCIACNLG